MFFSIFVACPAVDEQLEWRGQTAVDWPSNFPPDFEVSREVKMGGAERVRRGVGLHF